MASDHTLKFRNKKLRDWQPVFLVALARTGLVGQAAREAGVNPKTAYHARDLRNRSGKDFLRAQRFAQAWDDARQEALENIEVEVRRRALQGSQRTRHIYYKGKHVGTETVHLYSDQLLIFLLKTILPEKYGDHSRRKAVAQQPDQSPPRDLIAELDELTRRRWAESLPLINDFLAKQASAAASAESASFNPEPSTDPNA